ncbi:MAG TPA: hypothetical protein VL528_04680 [Oxalicibacterium sp.]|jgi:hypothetical protein|nr:hypothetical protein [Oxalicibacterium sp.]
MDRKPDATYDEYSIFTVAVPTDDHRWLATSEVQRPGADGIETFQEFGGPCYGNTCEEALEAVMLDTRHKIDEVLARPC